MLACDCEQSCCRAAALNELVQDVRPCLAFTTMTDLTLKRLNDGYVFFTTYSGNSLPNS